MGRPRKYDTPAERYRARKDRAIRERIAGRMFCGIDGEGTGRDPHKYVLLGVGDAQIASENGLSFHDIMSHLWECFNENPEWIYCGFFLSYDFTHWVKGLPEERARILLTDPGIAKRSRRSNQFLGPFPAEYEGWKFDFLGMKRFKLSKAGSDRWMYVNDAGPYFQQSLMSVIDPGKWDEPVVSDSEYALLLKGKSSRDSAGLDADMRKYNALENDVLARLMGRLDKGFMSAGIRLNRSQWYGPGQAAQKWMGNVKVPSAAKVREVMPEWAADAAARSYFGGWFEITAHGHIPGETHEYDINSAYPYIASRLPCLLHGQWIRGTSNNDNALVLRYARVGGRDDTYLGSMLHRLPDGNIIRPYQTQGWFWDHELDAAWNAGLITGTQTIDIISYIPCDCPPPMRGLAGMYDERLRVGKNTPQGRAYKLVYNSVYGKTAQSVGHPRFGIKMYASLITAGCRTMILDAIATHPEKDYGTYMVATDGVYFRSPHPGLTVSTELGGWSHDTKENLTIFKPGVYWDDRTRRAISDGEAPGFRARGISARDFAQHLAAIDSVFERQTLESSVPFDYPGISFRSSFGMVTARQALQRNDWASAGRVFSPENTQDSDPAVKRRGGHWRDGIWRTLPHNRGPVLESKPYEGDYADLTDEYGVTDDGYVWDHWRNLYT